MGNFGDAGGDESVIPNPLIGTEIETESRAKNVLKSGEKPI